jgi:hypothetical protein
MRLTVCVVLLTVALPARAELFVDVGVNASEVRSAIANRMGKLVRSETGLHVGLGARRSVGERSDIGVRLELDSLGSDLYLAVRALDYRYHVSERFAISGFLGAARLDLATPAWGYYLGTGATWKNVIEGWDLNVDFSVGDKIARDNLLPSDPQGGMPDNFHDVYSLRVAMSYAF